LIEKINKNKSEIIDKKIFEYTNQLKILNILKEKNEISLKEYDAVKKYLKNLYINN